MPRAFAEIAFTPTVQSIQQQHGSAASYAKFLKPEVSGGDRLSEREVDFISERDGFYHGMFTKRFTCAFTKPIDQIQHPSRQSCLFGDFHQKTGCQW